ncbi:hypothetical protein MTYP_00586 [Methylophilaceae bacterium]|nr:hypothetical protein MTYP_00586 [Methylophilaceae bacterium]
MATPKATPAEKKPAAPKKAPAVKTATAKAAPVKKPVAAKKPAAEKAPAVKKAAAKTAKPKKIGAEERYRMVEVAAYFLAERNNFKGSPVEYWTTAEAQIDVLLSK